MAIIKELLEYTSELPNWQMEEVDFLFFFAYHPHLVINHNLLILFVSCCFKYSLDRSMGNDSYYMCKRFNCFHISFANK